MINSDWDQKFTTMKKCFLESGFPVIYDRLPCGRETYAFRSLIPGLPDADVHAWYDSGEGYASLSIEFPDAKFEDKDVLEMEVNRLNCYSGLFHYVVCPDCGALEMRAGIYVKDQFREEKFKSLLKRIADELRESVPDTQEKTRRQK